MKYAVRYAALAMATLSGITFLSGFLRLLVTCNTYHRGAPSAVGPFETLFTGVACLGFGRLYHLLGRSKSNAISGTQTEIEIAYVGFIFGWFGFLFMVYKMNPPLRDVSALVFVALCILAASVIVVGFVMRRRFFKLTTEVLPHDPRKASQFWRGANFISFCCAINPTIYGVVLKILGGGWLGPGILFGLSLGLLLLWRPPQLAASGVQPG